MSGKRILYVEDDESLAFVTQDNLILQGFDIVHVSDGEAALAYINGQEPFDLYILDVMLPKVDGFQLASRIRAQDTHTPILFLSAKTLKEDRLHGLRLGADDYLVKPFSIEELTLKIQVFLRRSQQNGNTPLPETQQLFPLDACLLDMVNLTLKVQEETFQLTHREAELLRLFFSQPNTTHRRSDILESIWGKDDYFLGRSLDVFISRLRKRLQNSQNMKLVNIHGVGFKLVV